MDHQHRISGEPADYLVADITERKRAEIDKTPV
jgi:hypothetical protein